PDSRSRNVEKFWVFGVFYQIFCTLSRDGSKVRYSMKSSHIGIVIASSIPGRPTHKNNIFLVKLPIHILKAKGIPCSQMHTFVPTKDFSLDFPIDQVRRTH